MLRHRTLLVSTLALLAALGAAPRGASAYGYLNSYAACSDSTVVVFQWTFHDDPAAPAQAAWVGFDVVRRTVGDCSPYVRVNDQPFLRTPGATEVFEFVEPTPVGRALLEYHVVPVDAARQPITPGPVECDGCAVPAYVTCPAATAPLTQGTVTDLGWAVMVMPCAGSCYTSFYVSHPDDALLRPYAGTSTVVRLFGTPACGTLEGCTLALDHFDLAPCDVVVPTLPSTWGRLKTRYR